MQTPIATRLADITSKAARLAVDDETLHVQLAVDAQDIDRLAESGRPDAEARWIGYMEAIQAAVESGAGEGSASLKIDRRASPIRSCSCQQDALRSTVQAAIESGWEALMCDDADLTAIADEAI